LISHTRNSGTSTVAGGRAYGNDITVQAGPVMLDITDTSDTIAIHTNGDGTLIGDSTSLLTFIVFKLIGPT